MKKHIDEQVIKDILKYLDTEFAIAKQKYGELNYDSTIRDYKIACATLNNIRHICVGIIDICESHGYSESELFKMRANEEAYDEH
ncbi:MAG: hypothetical protein ACI4MZ_01245 [Christensenellales bacterium]